MTTSILLQAPDLFIISLSRRRCNTFFCEFSHHAHARRKKFVRQNLRKASALPAHSPSLRPSRASAPRRRTGAMRSALHASRASAPVRRNTSTGSPDAVRSAPTPSRWLHARPPPCAARTLPFRAAIQQWMDSIAAVHSARVSPASSEPRRAHRCVNQRARPAFARPPRQGMR